MFSNGSTGAGGANWRQMNTRSLMADPIDYTGGSGGDSSQSAMMATEFAAIKQHNEALQAALYEAQSINEKLRNANRRLKVDCGRLEVKLKRVTEAAKAGGNITDFDALTETTDYKNVKDFLLIGGDRDPLDITHVAAVKDISGREFKSGERYLWFKMAEHFGDVDSAKLLLTTDDAKKAQEIVDKVKNFEQAAWDAVKLKHFEEYQRMKFDQNRALRCLLLKTAPHYLAIASQDKVYGTGWRKQRMESDRTGLWDGENLGGKVLMKLRDEYTSNHSWLSTTEEQEAKKAFDDKKQTVWRRDRPKRDYESAGGRGGTGRGSGGAMLGKRGRGGMGSASQGYGNGYTGFFGTGGYTNFSTPSTVIGYGRNNYGTSNNSMNSKRGRR